MTSPAATFGAVFAALYVAHQVGDYWVVTGHQSAMKGARGWTGSWACAKHVTSYTVTTTLAVIAVAIILSLPVTVAGIATGQIVSAVTHYWADRRYTLAWLAGIFGPDKVRFYRLGQPRAVRAFVVDPSGPVDADPLPVEVIAMDANGVPVAQVFAPWDNPSLGTGAWALDQSWHYLWLGVAALLTAIL